MRNLLNKKFISWKDQRLFYFLNTNKILKSESNTTFIKSIAFKNNLLSTRLSTYKYLKSVALHLQLKKLELKMKRH